MKADLEHADRARFTNMEESTQGDWKIIVSHFGAFARALPGRILAHLE
jgi:hypothetical protein